MDDEVQHRVTITQGFWLGKFPVTQAQWEAVTESNPSRFNGTNLPVETVSWDAISEPGGFMDKVNRSATAEGTFSLPTEAQWEYACRAGTTTALNSGKNLTSEDGACPYLDEVAWYWENAGEGRLWERRPVGEKKANGWGLHDMHGNVWEWCVDWHAAYTGKPLVDPRGLDSGSFRVIRGGGYYSSASECRAAQRGCDDPACSDHGAFRIARSSGSLRVQKCDDVEVCVSSDEKLHPLPRPADWIVPSRRSS
jgi:formylglycine-generating enzyme required for sulfatase activity